MRNRVPIDFVERVNAYTIFGGYRGIYTGHAFENTEKGKISAQSANLRPFFFLLYISKSGKIYIGTQYLGNYGSYQGIRDTLISFMYNPREIVPKSFRVDHVNFEDVKPTEVRIKIAQKPEKINGKASISNRIMVSFKQERGDPSFSPEVKRKLIPYMGQSRDKITKAVSQILRDSSVISVEDSQIEDCTMIGEYNGKQRIFYMMDNSSYATHFHLSVGLNKDGHPERDQTKVAMLSMLQQRIISATEHV